MTPEKRARLEAALANGDEPTHKGANGKAMYVGGIMLANASGDLTPEGRVWIELGGDDPYRYRGEVHTSGTGQTKHVMENGKRVNLMKLRPGPNGPDWHPTKKGRLRFKPMNRFEVRIPAIGHAKDNHTFEDVVIITDQMLTANSAAYDRKLDTTEDLRNMFRYTHTRAVRDHKTQTAFILEALQAYAANRYPNE